jgi:hypothetical protein
VVSGQGWTQQEWGRWRWKRHDRGDGSLTRKRKKRQRVSETVVGNWTLEEYNDFKHKTKQTKMVSWITSHEIHWS